MWAFLMSDAVTFATLLVSSGLLRVWSQDWPAPATVLHLPVAGVMTGFLLASSIAMAVSLTALKQGHQSRFRVALLFTIIGGGVFLLLQTWEWSHLIRQGLTLANNPWGAQLFGASFYVLTGFHGCHVIAGIVYLTIILLGGYEVGIILGISTRSPLPDCTGTSWTCPGFLFFLLSMYYKIEKILSGRRWPC